MPPRRTCYKCGNAGHFAESCPEPEKLCYNCKQPGHQSNDCPQPKTVLSKQCYTCGGVGHIQADCPSVGRIPAAGAGIGRCYTCGRIGHIARNCNNAGFEGVRSYHRNFVGRYQNGYEGAEIQNGSNFRVICYKCGGYNHFARDCQASGVKCYNCGKFGHISRDCPNAAGGDRSVKTCYRCGVKGHISKDCPNNNAVTIEAYD